VGKKRKKLGRGGERFPALSKPPLPKIFDWREAARKKFRPAESGKGY